MAEIIGCITTSHVPAISRAVAENLQQDAYWKPFFDAFAPLHAWLEDNKPDLVIVVFIDHGLNFFLDTKPTFAVGAATDYANGDEGFGPPAPRRFAGDAAFSWHLIQSLVDDEFDIASCQEMVLDHACVTAGDLLWPDGKTWPVPVIPVEINIIQHPLPSPKRCFKLGQAIGRAVRSYPKGMKVLVVASGGLSHQISQGGFINTEFDHYCMEKIVNDPEPLTEYTNLQFIDVAGSQGLEFMTWLTMRGTIEGDVKVTTSTYHAPISHTGGAVMLLDPRPQHPASARPESERMSVD
jgi:protocatechuate 4,5-dioxygenase, beta chain